MKAEKLVFLRKNLFDEGLVGRLSPDNIRELRRGELSPFSDYYGALLGIEQFLGSKKEYQYAYPDTSKENYSTVISHLLNNLFVPNYRTLGARLNDRIRKLLQKEKVLAGAGTLEDLAEGLSKSRERIAKLHKLGFSSSERRKLEEEFNAYLNDVLGFGEFLQESLFRLRPQIVTGSFDVSDFLRAQGQFVRSLKKSEESCQSNPALFFEELSKPEIEGEPIKEKPFFYKGKEYYSTRVFVKEWNRVINQIRQLEEIKEGKPGRKRFKLRMPKIRLPKKTIAGTLAGLIGAAGVLYAFPAWRDTLGLPVSQKEMMEVFYEQREYSDSLSALQTSINSDEIDEHTASYWEGKIKLTQLVEKMDGQRAVEKKYETAREILRSNNLRLIEQGQPEISEEEILKTFFDAGYVKKGERLACVSSNHHPELAAKAHLCSLFSRSRETMEPEEVRLFEAIKGDDVFYVGWGENRVFFLTDDGDKIKYSLRKEGEEYKIAKVEVE